MILTLRIQSQMPILIPLLQTYLLLIFQLLSLQTSGLSSGHLTLLIVSLSLFLSLSHIGLFLFLFRVDCIVCPTLCLAEKALIFLSFRAISKSGYSAAAISFEGTYIPR